ncbi:membrane protein [Staphylococcus aureus]|nr:membrane protein [Staphylococcus aureus]
MDKNTVLDKGYFISTILNVFFLLGLTFISSLENLYILIPYAILMLINAIYLVVKVGKINRDKSKI